jgi:PAS domain S-box-containing protein
MDTRREDQLIKWIAGASLLVMLLLLGFAYDGLSRYKAENDAVRRSSLVIKRTESLFNVLLEAESGCRGFLLTNDSAYLGSYHAARSLLDQRLQDLLVLLPDTDGVSQPYGLRVTTNLLMHQYQQLLFEQRLGRAPPGQPDPALMQAAKERMDHLRRIYADLMQRHGAALLRRTENERSLGLVTPMMILLYALLALAGIALLFFRMTRTLDRVKRAEREARQIATERDREARIRELAERSLKRVLDSSPGGIMAFRAVRDAGGVIVDFKWTMVNAAAERLTGRTAQELIGRRLLEEMPGNHSMGLFDRYVEVVESGVPSTSQFFYEQDGIKAWFENNAVRLLDGFVVTFNDITEARRQQQIVQESERLTVTGRFARMVAHEVRNPLTNIQLALEQLEEEFPPGADGPGLYTDILRRNAGRIGTLITQVLHSSRPMDMELKPGAINTVLSSAYELVKDRCELIGVETQMDLQEDLPFVPMDSETLTIAFVNLCVNAIEAMEEDKGHLRITSREVRGMVQVTVEDDGKGMTDEERERVFQPFFSARKGGMGLGLTESRNILNAHGVQISLESAPGKGTTFTLMFPVAGQDGAT